MILNLHYRCSKASSPQGTAAEALTVQPHMGLRTWGLDQIVDIRMCVKISREKLPVNLKEPPKAEPRPESYDAHLRN